MVFYFTATGNSLYVAKKIDENCISIPQALKQNKLAFSSDSIGIIAPIYGHEMPNMVKKYIKEADFDTKYFYVILTYGNRHANAAELAYDFLKECKINASYINVIQMVDNWLPSFDMNEQIKIDKHIDENLSLIINDIKNKRKFISPVSESDRLAHKEFTDRMKMLPPDLWQNLIKIGDRCVGCEICENVCPSKSIKVVNSKALFTPGKCENCLACVHACPQKAIGLTIEEKNKNARYRNENISLQEIINSNCQIL